MILTLFIFSTFFTHYSCFLSLFKLSLFYKNNFVFLDKVYASKAQTIYKHQLYHHLIHMSHYVEVNLWQVNSDANKSEEDTIA